MATDNKTYGAILKSSALIGASSALTIVVRIVRTKILAILLGPAGVGFMGLYMSIVDLGVSLFGMGVQQSGVREIAQGAGSDDLRRVSVVVRVVRWTTLAFALAGSVLLVAFARPISQFTFGDPEHGVAVALLALAMLFTLAGAAESAVLQGTRRIAELAKVGVWTAALSTATTIPLVYVFREDGIVPSIVATGVATLLSARWYSRRATPTAEPLTRDDVRREAGALLRLGFAFMLSGFMVMGSAYAVRIIVLRELGVDSAGLYQAAWVIGGLYIGFILQAMGTDFYPRLAAVAHDDEECTRLVNEQTLVGVLIAGPGVLATLTLTPIVITLLYSDEFSASVEALRWICLGMSLRVITWPMGFIVVARGLQRLFIAIDLSCTLVHVAIAWLGVRYLGLDGAGVAFFGMYVFHALITYPIARRLCGFRWSAETLRLSGFFVPLTAAVFVGLHVLPGPWAIGVGMTSVVGSSLYSVRALTTLIPHDRLPASVLKILRRLHLAPTPATP